MKKILGLIAVTVVISTGLSFAVARWVAGRPSAVTADQLRDTAWLTRELKLSADQTRTLERLEAEFKSQLEASCAAHCAARFALGDELMKSTVDSDRCRTQVDKMNAAQAESERVTLAHILKVRALLDEPQARRYSRLIHDQVCSMPMGAP